MSEANNNPPIIFKVYDNEQKKLTEFAIGSLPVPRITNDRKYQIDHAKIMIDEFVPFLLKLDEGKRTFRVEICFKNETIKGISSVDESYSYDFKNNEYVIFSSKWGILQREE